MCELKGLEVPRGVPRTGIISPRWRLVMRFLQREVRPGGHGASSAESSHHGCLLSFLLAFVSHHVVVTMGSETFPVSSMANVFGDLRRPGTGRA